MRIRISSIHPPKYPVNAPTRTPMVPPSSRVAKATKKVVPVPFKTRLKNIASKVIAAERVRQRGSSKLGCAVHCIRVVRCIEKADQKKQKHKSGENSSDDQREIAFLFHNENPFLCRGRLPTTFRSRELMIESSRQSFTRIRGSILPYSRSTTKLMIIMRAAISTRMP